VWLLTKLRLAGSPLGFVFAFANCALFASYIVLGHRLAADGGGTGVDRLAAAMPVALAVATLIGIRPALPALASPWLVAAGIGVGITSSVVPYVCDQLAMARLPRASFALLLALLPATACLIGMFVLHQVPRPAEATGIALVVAGVGWHRAGTR
jgi:inner membrane transporter RhtA